MADNFRTLSKATDSPATKATAITPSDSVALTNLPRAIYVGVAGDVSCRLGDDSVSVLFKAMPVGFHPIRPSYIHDTGTAATNIVAVE